MLSPSTYNLQPRLNLYFGSKTSVPFLTKIGPSDDVSLYKKGERHYKLWTPFCRPGLVRLRDVSRYPTTPYTWHDIPTFQSKKGTERTSLRPRQECKRNTRESSSALSAFPTDVTPSVRIGYPTFSDKRRERERTGRQKLKAPSRPFSVVLKPNLFINYWCNLSFGTTRSVYSRTGFGVVTLTLMSRS